MATTPNTHSRTSSTSSFSSRSSSSSPTYRLFPRSPKPSHTRNTSLNQQHLPPPLQPAHPSTSLTSTSTSPHPTTSAHPHTHLTTIIERATLPILAHLNAQLSLTRLEADRDRVRRQIQRQETVLTLSELLRVWGDDYEECSSCSGDEEEEED